MNKINIIRAFFPYFNCDNGRCDGEDDEHRQEHVETVQKFLRKN